MTTYVRLLARIACLPQLPVSAPPSRIGLERFLCQGKRFSIFISSVKLRNVRNKHNDSEQPYTVTGDIGCNCAIKSLATRNSNPSRMEWRTDRRYSVCADGVDVNRALRGSDCFTR